jgi:hypothetical protein
MIFHYSECRAGLRAPDVQREMEPMVRASDPEDSPIIATEADGMVRVAFRADGLIESVDLAPRAKRLALDDLAEAILKAVSAAQQEMLRRAADSEHEAGQEAAQRLSRELADINAEYLRQTAIYEAMGADILKRMEG